MNRKGQGLVEYIFTMTLIAIALIAAVTFVGTRLAAMFTSADNTIQTEVIQ